MANFSGVRSIPLKVTRQTKTMPDERMLERANSFAMVESCQARHDHPRHHTPACMLSRLQWSRRPNAQKNTLFTTRVLHSHGAARRGCVERERVAAIANTRKYDDQLMIGNDMNREKC